MIPSFFKFWKNRQILSRNRCSASINEVSFFKNIMRKKWNGVFSNIVKGWFIFFIYTNKRFWLPLCHFWVFLFILFYFILYINATFPFVCFFKIKKKTGHNFCFNKLGVIFFFNWDIFFNKAVLVNLYKLYF